MDAERIRQYREFAAWRQHAANGSVERKCGEIITELCDVADAALPGGYDYLRAQLAAATTETTEQAWEIAKLRYYVEALERRLAPSKRQQAAEAASHALAQHNPPQWIWDRDAQVKELQARILQLEVDRSIPMKLRDDTDTVVWALKPDNVPGAINWGDLGAREVQEVVTDERRWYRVVIEEADPSNDALHAAVLAGLAALGWNTDDIELETAW